MNPRIKELKQMIAAKEAEIKPLKEELAALNQAETEARAEFKIGDIVEWRAGPVMRRGRVVGFGTFLADLTYDVQHIRRDGTDGERKTLYPWHRPVLVASKQ